MAPTNKLCLSSSGERISEEEEGDAEDGEEEGVTEEDKDSIEDLALDGGWAWMVCLASFFANFVLDGVLFSFGVLLLRLLDDFGDSKSKTAWVGSTLLGLSMSMGPVVSLLLEFYSCRQVMILGSFISSFGFILSLFAPNVETLIFTYGVLGGAGFGLSFITAILIVGLYFNEKRALATGIAMSGSGVGTFAVSYATERLLDKYDWRGTILITAGLVLNCCVCGALLRPLVKRETPILPCCTFKNTFRCCRNEYSGPAKEIVPYHGTVKLPQSETNFSLNSRKLPAIHQLIVQDRQIRLCQSSENMFPQITLDQRKYKSDIHLHNMLDSTITPDVDNNIIKRGLQVPTKRKDIFYSGSIYNLPEYKKDPNMNSFLRSMTNLNTAGEDTNPGDYSEPLHADSKTKSTFISAHKDLLCDKLFLMLLFTMVCWTGQASIVTYIPDLAVSKGVSRTQAALLISALGATNTVGRLIAGWLTNRKEVDSVVVYTCAIFVAGLVSGAFPYCTSFSSFVVCSCIFGLCMASCVSLRTIVLADVLGVSKLTNAFGIVAFLQGLGFTVGPPISGALYDTTQSFYPPFMLAAGLYMVSAFTCACVRPAQKWLVNPKMNSCRSSSGSGDETESACGSEEARGVTVHKIV